MTDPKDNSPDFRDLRRRAEERLETEALAPEDLSPAEAARLIHELQVHQIELEMQNQELRQAQVQLAESRDRYVDLYDFAPVGYLTLDKAGKILEANLTAATLLGLERSRLLERLFPLFLVEADRRPFRQMLHNSLNHSERRGEFRLQDGNGNLRVVLLDILFLKDAQGQDRCRLTLTDITELKQAQEEARLHKENLEELVAERTAELTQANEQLRALFEAAPLGIGVFGIEGTVIRVNPANERIFGWSKEEFEGHFPLSMPPEPAEEFLKPLQRVLQGESFTGVEIKQQRKDGALIDVSISAAPLHDAEGHIRGFIGLAEDITERKRGEEALQTQARILESMAEAVTVTDDKGYITYTNPAFDAMFGYKPGELVGRHSNVLNFYPPEENTRVVKKILRRVMTDGVWSGEFRNCRKDGHPFFTAARISALEVHGKKLYISVQEDITERKRAEEALRQAKEEWERTFDAVVDYIAILDKDHHIIRMNRAMAELLDGSPEKAETMPCYRAIHGLDQPPDYCPHTKLLVTGQKQFTEVQEFGRTFAVTVTPLFSSDQELIGSVHVARDITEEKLAQEEIRRLASFPELNPHPVLEVDRRGRVLYANPAARHAAAELGLAQGVKAFLPPNLKKFFTAADQGGPRQYSFDRDFDRAAFAVTFHLPHDLPTARLYALDITQRKTAEKELQASEAKFRSLFENMTEGVVLHEIIYDHQGAPADYRVLAVNPAFTLHTGLKAKKVVGRTSIQAYGGDEPPYLETFARVAATGEPCSFETYFPPLKRYFSISVSSSQPGRFFTVFEDITERRRAEMELRERTERYELVVAGAGAAIWDWDVPNNHVFYSPQWKSLHGYAQDEAVERVEGWSQSLHPEDAPRVLAALEEHFQGKTPVFAEEYRVLCQDGSVKWVFDRGLAQHDPEGRVVRMAGSETDITERKRAEEALRQSEELFRKIFKNAAIGIAITDWEGRFLQVNPAHCQLLGYTEEELRRLNFAAVIHPEDREANVTEIRRLQAGEIPYFEVENRYRNQRGQTVWVHKFVSVLTDTEGQPAYMVALVTDITERQRTQEALRESEERYRSLFENNHAVMLLIDPESGNLVDANPAALAYYGYSREELLALKITDLNILDPQEVFGEMHRSKTEECQHFEFRHRLASGDIRDVEVFSGPIRIKGRELLYSIVHDDTARKQAEEALRRAHDELEERVEDRTTALRLANEQLLWEMEERQEAEDKLRESEARFTAFMKYLPGPAVMRDIQGRYLFANEAWEQVTGKSKQDWQGKLMEELWPRQEAGRYLKLDQQVLLAGEPLEALEPLDLADGRHYFLSNRFPIRDKDGLPYMVGVIEIDITGRIKAEEAARQQTRLFEAFFDNSITPLVFLDPQFNFIRVNQAYARACHREVGDFAGRNHFDLYPSEAKLIFEEVVRTKIPYLASARPFIYPDHPEWGVTYWDWSLVPILDEAGEVDFLVFSLKEVTEQVQAAEERRRLVEILENTPDFVGIADFYGNLQYLNRAGRAMVGVGPDEDVTNLKVLQMHPHWVGEMILADGSPTARKKGVWQMESALLHRDGREIPVSQVILAHKESTGRVQFFSTIARDISDLMEAQENILRQASILNGINTIFREALTSETEEDLGRTCLAVAEDLTNSRFGFIDELNEQGAFDALAFSDPGWDMCRLAPVRDPAHLKNIPPAGLLATSVQEGRPLIANDPASHPGAAGLPEGHPPLTAYLGVPLRLGGQTIGLIGLGNKIGGYTVADQEAVETLAPSIVEALSHYRSKEALKKSERRLRHLADQLLTAQEDERKRLAAELHDELGHALLTLKLAFSAIAKNLSPKQKVVKQKIQVQLDFINEVIEEVRRLYHHLSPGDVEDLGLSRALQTLIEDFALYRPHITWKVDLPSLNGLFSLPVQTIIYRIIQEALTNIGKHANPEHVTVFALREDSRVHFRIQDDGAGFDVALLESTSGVGLAAMEERLNMIGGSFTVSSKKEEGTEISFSIPTLPEDERS